MVGKNDGAARATLRDALRAQMRRLEAQPAASARAAVRRGLSSEAFARFKNGESIMRGEEWAVAILDAARAHELGFGARPRVVQLSSDSVSTHPQWKTTPTMFWLRIQRILDEGEFYKRERDRVFWMLENDKPWKVVIKQTNADEIYLKTCHRTRQRQVEVLRGRR